MTIQETVDSQRVPSTCKLIKGDKRVGQFKRTVVRTDLDRLVLPFFYLCLGDRNGGDLRFCNPIATLDQVVFLLTVQTSCTPVQIQQMKEYARAYVNDPANALSGMPTLRLDLTDTCVEVPANQVTALGLGSIQATIMARRAALVATLCAAAAWHCLAGLVAKDLHVTCVG